MPRTNSQINSYIDHFHSLKSGGKPLFLTCSLTRLLKNRTSKEEGLAPARICFLFLLFCLLSALPAMAAEVPEGFIVTQVATGMTSVTRMALLPDGRILVCEQSGNVR